MSWRLRHLLSLLLLVCATPTCADEPHVTGKTRFVIPDRVLRFNGPECFMTVEQVIEKSRKECPKQPAPFTSQIVRVERENENSRLRSMPNSLLQKNDPLAMLQGPKWERTVKVHLPDMLLLLEQTANCEPNSTFNQSFEKFITVGKVEALTDPENHPYVRQLKAMLGQYRDQIAKLESFPEAHNAYRADLARERYQVLSGQNSCPSLLAAYNPEFGLTPMIEQIYKKLAGKSIGSIDEIYKHADTNEKKVLDLLFGRDGKSRSALNLLDFTLGADRANHYRNLLLHGKIPFQKGRGLSLSGEGSTSLFESPLLKNDLVKRVSDTLSKIAAKDPMMGYYALASLEDNLKAERPQDRSEVRRYLKTIIQKLEAVGVQPTDLTDEALLRADRLRTITHRLIAGLDSEIPKERTYQAGIFRQMVPEEKLALLTEADTREVTPELLRGALRTPLSGPTPFGDSLDLMDIKNLEFVLKTKEKDKIHAMSQVDLTEQDIARMQKNLHASRELYAQNLDHENNLYAPYFYGREISEENRKVRADDHWKNTIDPIAERLADYHIGLSAKDRMRLHDNLDPFSIELLGKLMQFAHTEAANPQAKFRSSIRPQIQELAKIAFEPEGKADLIQAMALLTQLNFESRAPIYEAVHSNLLGVDLRLPKGYDLTTIYRASASERDAVATQAEALLREDQNLSEGTKRALIMLSFLLREEGHDPEKLYAGHSLPGLIGELSLQEQTTKHAIRKKQRDQIEAIGSEGKKAITGLDNVETFLKKHNYGLPLNAEMGLLQFLERNGKTGDEALRQLMASVPPKVFADAIAQLRPVNSDYVIQQTLRDYLPHSLFLVSNGKIQEARAFAQGIQDLFTHGKLSEATLQNKGMLIAHFPECTQAEDEATAEKCMVESLHTEAARYSLERGDKEKADRLLAGHITDAAARAEKLEEFAHQNNASRKIRDRIQEKGLPWNEVAELLKYDDINSAAEFNRIEQMTSWAREQRAIERTLAEEETIRETEKRSRLESFKIAESNFDRQRQAARKAFEKHTNAEFKELTDLWETYETKKAGADKLGDMGKRRAAYQELGHLYSKIVALSKKKTGTYDIDQREEYIKLKRLSDEAQTAYLKMVNPNRAGAKFLVDAAEAKKAGNLSDEGKILSPEIRALRMIEKMVLENPELASELEQLSQNFGISGQLAYGNKVYGTADLQNLLERIRKGANAPIPSGSLANRAKSILDQCAAKPEECLLSAARLTELKKFYHEQSDFNGMFNLDRSGSAEEAAEKAASDQERLAELRTLQKFLVDSARRYERDQNKSHQEVMLARLSAQLFPELKGAQKSVMATAMREMRDNMLWGQSIADSIAQSTLNNPPPVNEGPEKLQEWMKKHGYESIFKDWKFHMTSGLNRHRMPEAQADELFQQMVAKSWGREGQAMARKKEIEAKLSRIVAPTNTRGDKPLWDWDNANLHLIAPTNPADRKDHHIMSYEEFTDLLNEYAEKNSVSMHSLNPAFRRNVRGEEELHDLVHGTLGRSKYRWDTANINANSFVTLDKDDAVADKKGISSVGVGYDFKDFKEAKPKIEKQAADMQWLLANNGELNRSLEKQGTAGEGAYRIWRSLTWRDPETENDTAIERMTNEAASTILNIGMMGDSRITFNGEEKAAGAVAQALRQDLKKLLGKQSDLLKNVDLGYELTEQGIWLAAGLVAGYGVAGMAVMGTELLAAKNGVQLVLAGKRFNDAGKAVTMGMRMEEALNGMANLSSATRLSRAAQAINSARNAGLTSKLVGYANQSKQMLMAGLEGKLYEKGYDIVTARLEIAYYGGQAETYDLDKNGVPDWKDALNNRKPFHFKDVIEKKLLAEGKNKQDAEAQAVELAKLIDSDDNGIPDQKDISEFGVAPEKYTMGSLTKLAQDVKENSKTMALSPWAAGLAGRTVLRPFGRFLQKAGGGRLDGVPKYLESMKSFAGMSSVSLLRSMVDSDPDRSMLEELERNWNGERAWKKLKESGYNSTFTLPIDDIFALRYLTKNPQATARQIWAIKSATNHAQDYLQGFLQAAWDGKYTSGNGRETKNPFLAGFHNMGASFKLSEKASDPKVAALDLLPDIVRADIVAKSGTGKSSGFESLLDSELDTYQGKQKIRDLIKNKSNLEDLAAPEKHEAFFKMFSEILVREGADPNSIADAYRNALARAGKNEVRFGEVATFINNVAYEIKLQDLLAGKITAQDVIATRDATSSKDMPQARLLRLHHMLSVGEVSKPDGKGFVNKEVQKAVWDVANDFKLNPIKFQQFVLARKADPAKTNEAMTLRMLAMEMMNAERNPVASARR